MASSKNGGQKSYTPFAPVVCERIRRLEEALQGATVEKRGAIGDRDAARDVLSRILRERVNGSPVKDQAQEERAYADFGRALRTIEDANAIITGLRRDLSYVIAHSDEPGLFDDPAVDTQLYLKAKEEPGEEGEEGNDGGSLESLDIPGPIAKVLAKAGIKTRGEAQRGLASGGCEDWGLTKGQADKLRGLVFGGGAA